MIRTFGLLCAKCGMHSDVANLWCTQWHKGHTARFGGCDLCHPSPKLMFLLARRFLTSLKSHSETWQATSLQLSQPNTRKTLVTDNRWNQQECRASLRAVQGKAQLVVSSTTLQWPGSGQLRAASYRSDSEVPFKKQRRHICCRPHGPTTFLAFLTRPLRLSLSSWRFW